MSKQRKDVIAVDKRFRGYLLPNHWTLCVGAGISKGIAPEWFSFTFRLIEAIYKNGITEPQFSQMVRDSGWTLDSWIQSAANKYFFEGGSSAGFKDIVETFLYSTILEKSRGLGIKKHITRVLNNPKTEPKERVFEVCDFIENEFSGSSVVQISDVLIDSFFQKRHPAAVITFNADTFLETIITLKIRRDHYQGPPPHGHPFYPYIQVNRPSVVASGKVPIYHCHGSVAPTPVAAGKRHDSRHRLVFLEQEYLAMAGSVAAWGQCVFLHCAQSTKLAFVGMSMSDSNIRRWMAGLEKESIADRELHFYHTRVNPDHIWVRQRPNEPNEKEILSSSLIHMGIRPAWLDSWSELSVGMRNLMAIT